MRSAVGLAVHSNAASPVADSTMERDVPQAPGAIPYITGVHVAALTALDDPALFVRAFNDFGFRYLQIPTDSLGRPSNASAGHHHAVDRPDA